MNELVVYVQGEFEVPLEERKFETEFCFDCHLPNERTSYEQVTARTEEYTVDGEMVNPHAPHTGVEGRDNQLECRSCHKMHEDSPGIEFCYGCHHAGNFKNCSTCHGE